MNTDQIGSWFEIGIAAAAIISGLIIGGWKIFLNWRKRFYRRVEEQSNFVNTKIWELLSELRITYKASRVTLVQFHNGGTYMDGTSMRKMSISHQSCDPKITSDMVFRQDVLVSRFVEIIEMLHNNDPQVFIVKEMKDSNSKKAYDLHDTLGFSILPIYAIDSLIVYGYISLEWCDLNVLDTIDELVMIERHEDVRDQIGYLLNSQTHHR
jgi:hypothetical protein